MSTCFVPGCKTGYAKQRRDFAKLGKRIPSLFSCKLKDDLEKWKRAIPRDDLPFTNKARVCELHFDVNDIERYFTHKFPDGSVQKIEREKPFLKRGSIPTIFPNLPERFSKKSQKRKAPVERAPAVKKIKEEEKMVISPAFNYEEQHMDHFNLKEDIERVKLPNEWWLIHAFPDYVACARFNSQYAVDRKVFVKDDNSVKVFLHDCFVQADEKVSCVEELSFLLQKVDNYIDCPGVTNRCSSKCLGYIPMEKLGRRSALCKECNIVKKQKENLVKRQCASKLLYRSRNLYQRIVSTNRKCARLKKKVIKLKNQVDSLKSKCAAVKVESVKHVLTQFSIPQQEAVSACIEAAKKKCGSGQRYTIQWIYECLLIRIKSRKVYEHLRSRKILALPSAKTLSNYIKKIRGSLIEDWIKEYQLQ